MDGSQAITGAGMESTAINIKKFTTIVKNRLTTSPAAHIMDLTIIVKFEEGGFVMAREKIARTAKGLDKALRIIRGIILVGAVVCAAVLGVFTVVNVVSHGSTAVGNYSAVDIGPLTFALTGEVAPDHNAFLLYAWIMTAAAVAIIAVVCYAIHIIRRILAPMTQGNPFHPTVGKEIRRLAFASLIIGVIQNIMGAVETLNMLRVFDLNTLLQNSQIQSVTANFRYDLGFFVVFFVLLLMSHIFTYGEELQKLSDETL